MNGPKKNEKVGVDLSDLTENCAGRNNESEKKRPADQGEKLARKSNSIYHFHPSIISKIRFKANN